MSMSSIFPLAKGFFPFHPRTAGKTHVLTFSIRFSFDITSIRNFFAFRQRFDRKFVFAVESY